MLNKFLLLVLVLALFVTAGTVIAEEDRYGGTLVAPLPYDGTVGTLEPPQTARIQDQISIGVIFARLVQINPETLEVEPAIAESWDVSEDGLVFTFYLREGVKFHHGRELVADDIKFTYELIVDPAQATMAVDLMEGIKGVKAFVDGETDEVAGIEVIDDYTLRITLERINVDFLFNLAHRQASILPQDEMERLGDRFGSNPVGAGPFKFVHWVRGSEVVVEAFEDYYDGRPYLDRIIFRIMPEASARVAAFMAEELDYDIVFPADYQRYVRNPNYSQYLIEVPELWTRNIHFNLDVEGLDDKRVRQAFNQAIDRELIVDKLLAGKAYSATGWLPPTSPGYNPDLKGYDYNPEKAKQLMAEAGYTPDNPLEIEIIGTDHPAWGIQIVEAIMPMLADVGFKITPVLVDGATWLNRVTTGEFEAGIHSQGGVISPVAYLSGYFWSQVSRRAGNWFNYNNPDFDYYIEKAMETIDFDERMEYVRRAEEELVKDPPVWFYNYNMAVGIHQSWVRGLVKAPEEMVFQPFHQVWIDKSSPRK